MDYSKQVDYSIEALRYRYHNKYNCNIFALI